MATEAAVLGIIRSARPQFRSPHDRVAFAVHAGFLAAGYYPTAVGSRVTSAQEGFEDEVGIDGWNDTESAYAFRYSGTDGNPIILKCVAMGDMLMVDVAPGEKAQPLSFEIHVSDYVAKNGGGVNYGQLYNNLHELVDRLNSCILSKLSHHNQTADVSSTKVHTDHDEPESENIRSFTSESVDLNDHANMPGVVFPPVLPVGYSDRMPGPSLGVFPSRINAGFEGGMLLGPNDPRWGVSIGPNQRAQFPEGGIQGVPPGARFDPYGPPGVPGFEPSRFNRRPPGTHPDLEHFSPF